MSQLKLSAAATDAVMRIKALRQMGSNPSVKKAEERILANLLLQDVSDVALVLSLNLPPSTEVRKKFRDSVPVVTTPASKKEDSRG
jgi:hypothetical protein